ncbi:MAG: tetratricopeptide repeat-containing glycosyltransferase family protein [Terracidiphilus sp.]
MEGDPQKAAAQWHLLGCREAEAGNAPSAIQYFERAVALEPNSIPILLDLGNAFANAGENLNAVKAYGKALKLDPNSGHAWINLGNVFFNLRDLAGAIGCYTNGVRLMPKEALPRYSLGRALSLAGKGAEALDHLSQACRLDPRHTDSWIALGKTHQHLGHWDEALSCFDRALEIVPGLAEAHVDRAVVLLNQGNFREGWSEYEHRWETESFRASKLRSFGKPEWKGESIEGKRILLHAEQGFGDAIQFARFIPAVSALGANVILEVRSPLKELLSPLVAPGHTIAAGEPLPAFDCHCSFLSLGKILGIELDSIPSEPYLHVPADLVESAARVLQQAAPGPRLLRVALVWKGNPSHPWDALRSLTPAQLGPLGGIPGVQWYSLDKDARQVRKDWPQGLTVAELPSEHLDGFQRMAAVIEAVDLLISVDTAQAHLAGGLGKPVWLLLPLFYEWRWHSHLENSPWYPSARLFRQQKSGDWSQAIEDVAGGLKRMAAAMAGQSTLP